MHSQLNITHRHAGSRELAGLTWVSPNASLDRLDLKALERWTGPRAEKPIVPFDSLQYPDWYAQEKHWHPWVPHNRDELWWHQLTRDNTFRPLDDEVGAKQELLTMVKILDLIYRHIRPKGPRPDNAYLINHLDLGLPHPQAHARRFMLSASGYIRWLKAHRPDDMNKCLKEHLTSQDVERMLTWELDQPGGVGVILDLTRDRREMNIGLYLRHNIPVYYPWTLSAAADSALYRLSPSYLLSPDDETSSILSPNVDFFFQPQLPGHRGLAVTAPKLPPLTHQVLDFQGWIPRPISGKARQRCFQLFYFEDQLSDSGLTRSYHRIYHRFRLNVSLKPENLAIDVCVREKWKFDYAPPAGQFYDPTTGRLKIVEPTTSVPVPSSVHSSWGLMIPPLSHKDTGCRCSTQSKADDLAAADSERCTKYIVVQVDFGSVGDPDARSQNFVLRLPDQLHVPHDGGLWSS
ncbi:hypothetical protein BD769DRAFT_1680931 [Suillus cothurnatus]|jgi:hypothetical protein|nr:hypothetical protein BD769DRAFT_1680931 [Suillus cothurnatus]